MSERAVQSAYLSLGSNIAPARNLPAAVRLLGRFGRVAAVSCVWESAPVGFTAQPNFLNAAVLLKTPLSASALRREAIVAIEETLGRRRDPGNPDGPRTIDIDIALFGREVLRVDGRPIPDPQIPERPFLAVPLAELDPGFVHPELGRTLSEIAGALRVQADGLILRRDVRLDGWGDVDAGSTLNRRTRAEQAPR